MADRPTNTTLFKLKTTYNNENVGLKLMEKKNVPVIRRPALRDIHNVDESSRSNNVVKHKDSVVVEKSKTSVIKKVYSKIVERIYDPDVNDRNNPELVTEYIKDIYQYWRQLEDRYPIKPNFLQGHHCSIQMRAILVDWLIEVQINYNYYLQTLYLCISLIDRYLQDHKEVGKETLQLVGISALMIACKYEEIELTSVNEFVILTDRTFSKRQILKMEIQILAALNFNLSTPSRIEFLKRYFKIGQFKLEQYTLAKYLLELSLLDYTLSATKASISAAAACCLSVAIWDEIDDPSTVWTPTLQHYSNYKYDDFKTTLIMFANLLNRVDVMKQKTVQKKYSTSKYCKISTNTKLKGALIRKLTSPSTNKT